MCPEVNIFALYCMYSLGGPNAPPTSIPTLHPAASYRFVFSLEEIYDNFVERVLEIESLKGLVKEEFSISL